jgi:hypothetical protein
MVGLVKRKKKMMQPDPLFEGSNSPAAISVGVNDDKERKAEEKERLRMEKEARERAEKEKERKDKEEKDRLKKEREEEKLRKKTEQDVRKRSASSGTKEATERGQALDERQPTTTLTVEALTPERPTKSRIQLPHSFRTLRTPKARIAPAATTDLQAQPVARMRSFSHSEDSKQ